MDNYTLSSTKEHRNKKRSNISTCCKRKQLERKFAMDAITFLKNTNSKTLLDLWCWEWLDSRLFYEAWYAVTWVDISSIALELFKKNVDVEWIQLIEQDIANLDLPWSYDVIYANLSIQYFTLEAMRSISNKLESHLNPWWYLIVRLKFIEDDMYWKWDEIEQDMYESNGQVRHFFTEEKLRDIYSQFQVIKIYHDKEQLHCQDLWKDIVPVNFIIWIFQKE